MAYDTDSIAHLARPKTPSVIMMVGIPGSGKSYLAHQISDLFDIPIVSSDACRKEISGNASDQSVSRQAWELVYRKAEQLIGQGRSVIIDATHTSRRQRRQSSLRYRGFGARGVVAIHVLTSLEAALARNTARDRIVPQEVIERMHYTIEGTPPHEEDGFDFVIRLDNE